jgi:hypothetical protein
MCGVLPLTEGAGRKATMVSAIDPVLDSMGDSSVVSYTDRSLVTQDQWNGIIRDASDYLWLYGTAEYGYAADPETHGLSARLSPRDVRSERCCSIRSTRRPGTSMRTKVIRPGCLRRGSALRWTCSPR